MPNFNFLRLPDVIKKTGLPRTSIYRLIKCGKFPAPTRLTERSVGWLESDIDNWMQGRLVQNGN